MILEIVLITGDSVGYDEDQDTFYLETQRELTDISIEVSAIAVDAICAINRVAWEFVAALEEKG